MSYLTPAGFQKPTLSGIRSQVEAFFLASPAYGPGTDMSAEGPLGQIIASISTWASGNMDGLQEFYTSRDPDQATGVNQDEIGAESGVRRLPATTASISDVVLWASWASALTVPAGSLANASNLAGPVFSLQSDVVFVNTTSGPFRAVRLKVPTALVSGNVLSVVLNGTTYTYTVLLADATASAIAAFAAIISAGVFASVGGANYESLSGLDYLRIDGVSFTLGTYASFFTPTQQAQSGIFVATTTGAMVVLANSLDTILTPVTGWLSLDQPADAVAGTNVESDTAFRLRRAQSQRSGTGTDDAIAAALYKVAGVSLALVTSNRTGVVDSEGRPANCFESVVQGGNDVSVGQAIASTMPGGIKPYGLAYSDPGLLVTLPSGRQYYVNFSRPTVLYAWVQVTITAYDPDGGTPADYAAEIQDAGASYGNLNFGIGANFILQKMYAAVYSVKGLYAVSIQIATTPTEGGSPSYAGTNIAVDSRHFLSFDPSRVVVIG